MTTTLNPAASPAPPLELLRGMLEEQYAVDTARLTRMTVHAALPQQFGRDRHTLAAQTAFVRERIAATARALRLMSEGAYGTCEDCRRPIPLGRLRATPQATQCASCEHRHPLTFAPMVEPSGGGPAGGRGEPPRTARRGITPDRAAASAAS